MSSSSSRSLFASTIQGSQSDFTSSATMPSHKVCCGCLRLVMNKDKAAPKQDQYLMFQHGAGVRSSDWRARERLILRRKVATARRSSHLQEELRRPGEGTAVRRFKGRTRGVNKKSRSHLKNLTTSRKGGPVG